MDGMLIPTVCYRVRERSSPRTQHIGPSQGLLSLRPLCLPNNNNQVIYYYCCDLSRKQFPSPMVGSTPAAPSIPAWQRTVTSTERTRTTSSLTDSSETPGTTEPSDSKEQSSSKVSSLEQSSMNGRFGLCEKVTIGFGLTSNWLRKWHNFFRGGSQWFPAFSSSYTLMGQ